MSTLGWVLMQQAKLDEAENYFRLVLGMQRERHGARHPNVATALTRLGTVLTQAGRVRDAEEVLQEAYRINLEAFGHDSLEVAGSLNLLAVTMAIDLPRLGRALQLYREAFEIRERLGRSDSPAGPTGITGASAVIPSQPVKGPATTAETAASTADTTPASLQAMLAQPGSLSQVEAVLRDAQRYAEITYGKSSWEEAFFLAMTAWVMLEERKFGDAEAVIRQCLAIRESLRRDDWSTHHARHMLGYALAGQNRFLEAETLMIDGYRGMKARAASMPEFHRSRAGEAVYRLIRFYQRLDRPAEARKWWEEFDRLEPDQQKVLVPAPPR